VYAPPRKAVPDGSTLMPGAPSAVSEAPQVAQIVAAGGFSAPQTEQTTAAAGTE
jgi:hypothetical protein